MQPPSAIKINDPMKTDENGKKKFCCCFSWCGRKVKTQDNNIKDKKGISK